MKTCYSCKSSFEHEGDPIDGHEFCSFVCAGDYIANISAPYSQEGNQSELVGLGLALGLALRGGEHLCDEDKTL